MEIGQSADQSVAIRTAQFLTLSVSVGSSLRAGVRLLVDRPASVLPVYLLVLGLTATARVPILLALGAALGLVAADGRLETLVAEADSFVTDGAGAGFDPETAPELPAGLEAALMDVFTLPVIGLVVIGGVLSVGVGIIANGLGNAAAINGVYGALSDRDGVADAVGGIGRDWKAFVGISILQVFVLVLAAVPLVLGASLFVLSPIAGALGLVLGVLFGGFVAVVGLLLLAFAGQSVVVDDAGFVGAVRRSAGFPFGQPGRFVGYVLVAIGVFGLLSVLSTVFGALGVSQLSGLVGPLILLPFLDIFKVALYADRPFSAVATTQAPPASTSTATSKSIDGPSSEPTSATEAGSLADLNATPEVSSLATPDATPESSSAADPDTTGDLGSTTVTDDSRPPHRTRFVAAFTDGLVAVGSFVRGHPAPIAAATGVFGLATLLGFQLTAGFGTEIPLPEDVRGVFGTVPIGAFVMIAANNWLVSATAAYGGVAFGLPTAVDMLLNGFIVGALYGVSDPLGFLALVAPHGVIELPAIFIAGGLGFHVAYATLGVFTGRNSGDDLAAIFRRTYRVLLGLAVILVIAAFVEAFLTPPIAAYILG